eukprot:TRINITY_DN294_c0_g1_i1.p1 TRINITY_DN294_c0_g1~~TRINITY_DN294_c0_g1_i1.p1  ORF type:complete len:200 (-),score=48.24 TRINITY_DN294_c0_g1_i1:190-789(-)
MSSQPLNGLTHLLKAPSRKVVDGIFVGMFRSRLSPITTRQRQDVRKVLEITLDEAGELLKSVRYINHQCLYDLIAGEEIMDLFPSSFHDNLKTLIAKVITAHLRDWRVDAMMDQPSLPRLESIDWRIHVKNASDRMANMSVPTALIELKVNKQKTSVDQEEETQSVLFELNKETVTTMLSSLGAIRDQLSSIKGTPADQ